VNPAHALEDHHEEEEIGSMDINEEAQEFLARSAEKYDAEIDQKGHH